jgi:hypothetical protein
VNPGRTATGVGTARRGGAAGGTTTGGRAGTVVVVAGGAVVDGGGLAQSETARLPVEDEMPSAPNVRTAST